MQAAGKSTFFRTCFNETHVLISKDLMRNTAHPEKRQRELLRLTLQAGHAVIIDNTHPIPDTRIPLIEIAHEYGARVTGYYFPTTIPDALRRNQERTGVARVPPVAIYSTAAKLMPPAYAEGFDRLYCVQMAKASTPADPHWIIEEIQREE